MACWRLPCPVWGERLAADPSPEGWGSWAGTLTKEKKETSEEGSLHEPDQSPRWVGSLDWEHGWDHTRHNPWMNPKGLWILCTAWLRSELSQETTAGPGGGGIVGSKLKAREEACLWNSDLPPWEATQHCGSCCRWGTQWPSLARMV